MSFLKLGGLKTQEFLEGCMEFLPNFLHLLINTTNPSKIVHFYQQILVVFGLNLKFCCGNHFQVKK